MIDLTPNNPYHLTLRSPVLAASGCLGYGIEYARLLGLQEAATGLGALVTRTTTLYARRSAPPPRMIETHAGLLHISSEHNPGIRTLIERYAPTWATWKLPVIVSIAGTTPTECAEVATLLEGVEGVAGIEVALAMCSVNGAARAGQYIGATRRSTLLPLIAKIPYSPHAMDYVQAATDAGADAIALGGGLDAHVPEPHGRTILSGQLCGPATFPLILAAISSLAPQLTIPLIAGGGIRAVQDARALLDAGATAVAVGSALLADPRSAMQIGEALTREIGV